MLISLQEQIPLLKNETEIMTHLKKIKEILNPAKKEEVDNLLKVSFFTAQNQEHKQSIGQDNQKGTEMFFGKH